MLTGFQKTINLAPLVEGTFALTYIIKAQEALMKIFLLEHSMKSVLAAFAAICLLTSVSYANQCLGEAQIIATVAFNEPVSADSCRATVQANVRFYAESQVCPLSFSDVVSKGILIPADSFQCSLLPGDEISGVIVLDEAGNISLDNE
jgi:hypothetical protein